MPRHDGTAKNKHNNGRRNQRSKLPANRELRVAMNAERPKAFGIRRRLTPETQTSILGMLDELYANEDIPNQVRLRDSLHVTLLPARKIGRQMMRGLVAGYELGKKSELMREEASSGEYEREMYPGVGCTKVFKGSVMYLSLISDQLRTEGEDIKEILELNKIKGFNIYNPMGLHISLGESPASHRLTRTEQRHVQHTIDERMSTIGDIVLQGWEVYP